MNARNRTSAAPTSPRGPIMITALGLRPEITPDGVAIITRAMHSATLTDDERAAVREISAFALTGQSSAPDWPTAYAALRDAAS